MNAEPPEVFTDICDRCGLEKTQFESCNAWICDCGQVLDTFKQLKNHQLYFKTHKQRRYKICVDCGSDLIKEVK